MEIEQIKSKKIIEEFDEVKDVSVCFYPIFEMNLDLIKTESEITGGGSAAEIAAVALTESAPDIVAAGEAAAETAAILPAAAAVDSLEKL